MKISTKSYYQLILIFGFIGSFFITSCAPEEKEPRVGEAMLRIINAAPESNEYSFFINDTLKTGQALKYGESSAYLPVSAGTNKVYTKLDDVILANTDLSLLLDQNKKYSLFLSGKASADSLIYVSTLDNNLILSDTMATVRFINVSPDSKNLNLVFQKNLVDSVKVISNINYRTASPYIKVSPLSYFLRIKKSSGSQSLANLDNYKLEAGKIYTIWTKGLVNDELDYQMSVGVLVDN